jgi:hypothetical protein
MHHLCWKHIQWEEAKGLLSATHSKGLTMAVPMMPSPRNASFGALLTPGIAAAAAQARLGSLSLRAAMHWSLLAVPAEMVTCTGACCLDKLRCWLPCINRTRAKSYVGPYFLTALALIYVEAVMESKEVGTYLSKSTSLSRSTGASPAPSKYWGQ